VYISIKKRMLIAGIIIIAIVTVFGSTVIFMFNLTQKSYDDVNRLSENTILLKSRLIEHISWSENLLLSAVTGNAFAGQTDPHFCAFGKWYYGLKQQGKAAPMSEEQRALFDKLEEPHKKLHATAELITKSGSTATAVTIYRTTTQAHLKVLREIFDGYIKNNEATQQRISRATSIRNATITAIIVISNVLVTGLSILVVTLFNKKFSRSFSRMENGIYRLSHGDLAFEMETEEEQKKQQELLLNLRKLNKTKEIPHYPKTAGNLTYAFAFFLETGASSKRRSKDTPLSTGACMEMMLELAEVRTLKFR